MRGLERISLRRDDYLPAATELLLQSRGEDAMAGLYEAADLQWWSTSDHELIALDGSFWRGPEGWVAMLLAADDGSTISADLIWRPSCDRVVRHEVIDDALAELVSLGQARSRPVEILASDEDLDFARRLAAAGFGRRPAADLVQTVRGLAVPVRPPLPRGLALVDARDGGGPYPRVARRSARAAAALRSATLYDPAFDLAVVTTDGAVCAHALCWLDRRNGIGLVEPLRTEDAYQRQGLARALLAECISLLVAGGARLVKVSHTRDNAAARALYEDAGFVPAFAKLGYGRAAED